MQGATGVHGQVTCEVACRQQHIPEFVCDRGLVFVSPRLVEFDQLVLHRPENRPGGGPVEPVP